MNETVELLSPNYRQQPALGLILGSGFGAFADQFSDCTILPYAEIPHFPVPTVAGHSGKLVIGSVLGIPCTALQGRFHYYEGHSMQDIAFPIRVLACLGIRSLIVTNAAGGLNPDFEPGDLMVIEDHINMTGSNPLIGYRPEKPVPRFPDMSQAYDPQLIETALEVAFRNNIALHRGVYIGVSGPCYETPAEIKMYRSFGADAIGMSTIPEVIVAASLGMRVCGLSCITNMAAGISQGKITHSEVLETTRNKEEEIFKLLTGIIETVEG
ncbi:MAG: purine-nucleoside phosphorylase [Acidobacteriota bacterium]